MGDLGAFDPSFLWQTRPRQRQEVPFVNLRQLADQQRAREIDYLIKQQQLQQERLQSQTQQQSLADVQAMRQAMQNGDLTPDSPVEKFMRFGKPGGELYKIVHDAQTAKFQADKEQRAAAAEAEKQRQALAVRYAQNQVAAAGQPDPQAALNQIYSEQWRGVEPPLVLSPEQAQLRLRTAMGEKEYQAHAQKVAEAPYETATKVAQAEEA